MLKLSRAGQYRIIRRIGDIDALKLIQSVWTAAKSWKFQRISSNLGREFANAREEKCASAVELR